MTYRYGKRGAMPYRFGKRGSNGQDERLYQDLLAYLRSEDINNEKRMTYRYGRSVDRQPKL